MVPLPIYIMTEYRNLGIYKPGESINSLRRLATPILNLPSGLQVSKILLSSH